MSGQDGKTPDGTQNQSMIERLNECHDWPCEYAFKFIAPHERADELATLLPDARVTRRPSRTGKYVSITATIVAESAEQVMFVYETASKISGVITL